MKTNKNFIVLIFANFVFNSVSKHSDRNEVTSLTMDHENPATTFLEEFSNKTERKHLLPEEEQLVDHTRSKEPEKVKSDGADSTKKDVNFDKNGSRARRDTSSHSAKTDLLFQYDENTGELDLSLKSYAFFRELLNSSDVFLSLAAPSFESVKWSKLHQVIEDDWRRRTQQLELMILTLPITPTANEFADFWRKLNDLDIDVEKPRQRSGQQAVLKQTTENTPENMRANELKKVLSELSKANTLESAARLWKRKAKIWEKIAKAHLSTSKTNGRLLALSHSETETIKELTRFSSSQIQKWKEMLEYQYLTPESYISATDEENESRTNQCLWIMRVEREDSRIARLVDYLSHKWRTKRRMFLADTKLSILIHNFCVSVARLHWLDVSYLYPWSKAIRPSVKLSTEDYNKYLDFIEQEFNSRVDRDTARIMLAIFSHNGKGPVRL